MTATVLSWAVDVDVAVSRGGHGIIQGCVLRRPVPDCQACRAKFLLATVGR